MPTLTHASIRHIEAAFRSRNTTPTEVLSDSFQIVDQHNASLRAFITLFREDCRERAARATEELARGQICGPLHGIPVALKDLIFVANTRTTCGSKLLSEHIAPFDATVVTRLQDAGALLLGKTNLHEFAYGVTTENPHFGTTANPWDTQRIAGGSSGGSAVAVVTGMCAGALGTDTGGSIRIPSALCGNVGLKPTFGRVSVYGIVELAQSLDCVGPMTRYVEDTAILMNILAGHDPQDLHTEQQAVPDYCEGLGKPITGWRLGRPQQHFFDNLDDNVSHAIDAACDVLAELGAEIVPLDLPIAHDAHAAALPILVAEASTFHTERFEQHGYDYGADVREMLTRGYTLPATDYVRAVRIRERAQRDFSRVFARVNALITPTVPIPAPFRSDVEVTGASESNRLRPLLTQNTRVFNLLGMPALSVPCGFSRDGLPIGLQIAGPKWSEPNLLQIGHAYEQATPWHTMWPDLG